MKEDTKNIADLLPESLKEVLSEESLSVLKDEFDRLVESKVNERISIATAAAEATFDEEANKRCTELVHKIEEAHKIGLEKVYQFLTEKYSSKITNLRKFYRNQIAREANNFKKRLCENVANVIENRVDKLVPYNDVRKAVKNETAMKVLESFKGILNVNEATANTEIRNAVLEGAEMLKKSNAKNDKLVNENAKLQQRIDEMAESYAFEKNIAQLDEDNKNFVIRFAKKAGIGYTNENMDYLCKLYEKKVLNERKELATKEMNNKKRNNLRNVNRRVLAERTSFNGSKSMLAEDTDLSNLIDAIEDDMKY